MIFILAAFLMARLDPETRDRFRTPPPYYKWGFASFLAAVRATNDVRCLRCTGAIWLL